MAIKPKAKSKAQPKSRISKNYPIHRSRWWMGLVIISLVGIAGVVIVRLSQANGGWCDKYFASRSDIKKVACYFAVDDLSTRSPGKVVTSATLIRSVDPRTGLAGAEGWYFDSRGLGKNGLIWGGPGESFAGTKGKQVRACWWLRGVDGKASVSMAMKSAGKVIAQASGLVEANVYKPYCVTQTLSSDLSNANFELRLTDGRVLANRMTVESVVTKKLDSTNLPKIKDRYWQWRKNP